MLGLAPPGLFGFEGRVVVAEITGSESFIHVTTAGATGVALARGGVELQPEAGVQPHVDPARVMAFDAKGRFLPTRPSPIEAAA